MDKVELQDWMRAGCPGDGVGAVTDGRCRTFVLQVWRGKGQVSAACQECGQVGRAGAMTLGRVKHGKADGVLAAAHGICRWMEEHSTLDGAVAEMAFGSGVQTNRVWTWADLLMRHMDAFGSAGMFHVERQGMALDRKNIGYRLEPEVGVSQEPGFTYREPEDGGPLIAPRMIAPGIKL